MKKLLIISALLPALLFGQQPKNAQVASGETFDENNIVISAGGTMLRTIPIAWTSGNSTLSLTGNITLTGNVVANGIGGATANGQVLLGNATSGDFQIGNISAGSGISLTPGPGTLQIAANQSLFQSVKVSGQNDIIATSPTANITIAATGGLVATTNNTTNTITLDGSGISSGSLFNGFTTSILATESVPSGWSLTGVNGIPEHTAPDADYKVVMKMAGTVATPTFSPVAGAVPDGHTITFSSGTSGVTFMATTNGTDPSRSVGTPGGTLVISGNTTIEAMAYKDGAYLIDSAVASAAYTIDPVPTLTGATINGTALTLTYSEAVSRGGSYSNAHFDLDMSTTGSNIGVTYVGGDGTTTHTYTAASAAVNGETVDLDFSGTTNSIVETGGYNQSLLAITSAAVTNSTPGGGGGPTLIASAGTGGTASGATTSAIDTTGANLLVVGVSWYAPGGGGISVSDSKGNTWTPVSVAHGDTNNNQQLFYCYGGTVGSGHTFDVSGSGIYAAIQVVAFSGLAAAPLDQQNQGHELTSWTSLQPGSITPSQANTVVVTGIVFDNNSTTLSIGDSYTITHGAQGTGGSHVGYGLAYKILSSAAAQNPAWATTSGSTHGAASIASFKY